MSAAPFRERRTADGDISIAERQHDSRLRQLAIGRRETVRRQCVRIPLNDMARLE
jgi:hypothetical protein